MTHKGNDSKKSIYRKVEEIVLRVGKGLFDPHKIFKELQRRQFSTHKGKPITDLEKTIKGMCRVSATYYYAPNHEKEIEEQDRLRFERWKTLYKKDTDIIRVKGDYQKELKDSRWYAFRTFVFAVRGKKCEHCGSTKVLQVHHLKYKGGCKAWEYTCNEVEVLCKKCHEAVHNIKK